MRKLILLLLLTIPTMLQAVDTARLQDKLDSLLDRREMMLKTKKQGIEHIRKTLPEGGTSFRQLQIYEQLYQEYYVFQFDSAMTYLDKGIQLAQETGNTYYRNSNTIHKAELLAIGGLYSEALRTIGQVDTTALDRSQHFDYYFSFFRIYSYWADYCNDRLYAPIYRKEARKCLVQAMPYVNKTDRAYEYYQGEYCVFVLDNTRMARRHYLKAIERLPRDSRLYAMACYALSGNYANEGRYDLQEHYMLLACISDTENCTMENFALQNLAMYIFEHDKKHIERAQRYISTSLEDAQFYNNRLRIIEVSDKLPVIVNSYQQTLNQRNRLQMTALIAISILSLFLLAAIFYIVKQTRRLGTQQKELKDNNKRLSELNESQTRLNGQLHELNALLVDTNRKREGLAKLYIDLCAKYIDRLKKQQTLVKRKIKANQSGELLSLLSSERLSEEDASTFLLRFDKAFLDLYPTFTEELNNLLRPESRIISNHPGQLTTDQRIMALIRLGVKESAEIADLLFYSPQTIYNYRSGLKGKAISKERFEEDVMQLCKVIRQR
ncbi:MAG: DUF6377 domain-containing protein [Prevotella sp.]|nr:DUF6377 domain-containing protein [Prevotella sp.]